MITSFASVEIHDEPTYSFGSQDNSSRYKREALLSEDASLSSVHGLLINGEPELVLGSGGGATGVHEHSAIILSERLIVAVGASLACVALRPETELLWNFRADEATCFGIHYSHVTGAIICHGELAISRISSQGNILWSSCGADIFTGGLRLAERGVLVEDFNGRPYTLCYSTGAEI